MYNFLDPLAGGVASIDYPVIPTYTQYGGMVINEFTKILYNQIHVIKPSYAFGNISNDATNTVEVWNAYEYTDITLQGITYDNLSGIELLDRSGNELDLPILISNLESQVFTIKASIDGNASDDGHILLDFNDKQASIAVSVSRAVLFDFEVSANVSIKERYSFNTRILPSLDNTEQRVPRITIPRVQFEYYYQLTDRDKRIMDGYLYSKNTNFSLPIYTQTREISSIVGDIVNVDIVGTCLQVGQDVLIKDDNHKEVIRVVEILSNSQIRLRASVSFAYSFPKLIPIVNAKMGNINNKTQKSKNFAEYQIVFNKNIDDINAIKTNSTAEFNKFNNLYILEDQNSGGDIEYTYTKDFSYLDNGYSKTDESFYNNISTVDFDFKNIADDRTEISKIKNLFNHQKGILNDLYSLSFTNNAKVLENVFASDIMIYVENTNLSTFFDKNEIRHIYFKFNDNQERIIEIDKITFIDNEREAIFLKNGLGVDVPLGNMISTDFVYLGRLNSDILTLEYKAYSIAGYSLQFHKYNDIS